MYTDILFLVPRKWKSPLPRGEHSCCLQDAASLTYLGSSSVPSPCTPGWRGTGHAGPIPVLRLPLELTQASHSLRLGLATASRGAAEEGSSAEGSGSVLRACASNPKPSDNLWVCWEKRGLLGKQHRLRKREVRTSGFPMDYAMALPVE